MNTSSHIKNINKKQWLLLKLTFLLLSCEIPKLLFLQKSKENVNCNNKNVILLEYFPAQLFVLYCNNANILNLKNPHEYKYISHEMNS